MLFQENVEKRRDQGIFQRRCMPYDSHRTVVWYCSNRILPRRCRTVAWNRKVGPRNSNGAASEMTIIRYLMCSNRTLVPFCYRYYCIGCFRWAWLDRDRHSVMLTVQLEIKSYHTKLLSVTLK